MAETTTIDVAGRPYEAAVSRPEGEGPWPAVVVIHDLTGFGDDVRRHCDNFAAAGYVAIAPDLYRGGNVACVVQTMKSMATNKGHAYAVVDAARRAVMARSDVDERKVGVCGFCMGGGFALISAADMTFAVAAPFYGTVPRQASRLQGICPTLAQYGSKDVAFVPHGRRLSEHLLELGVEHEVLFHDDAGHSFMNQLEGVAAVGGPYTPLRAEYDSDVEAVAWAKVLEFFGRHLGEDTAASR